MYVLHPDKLLTVRKVLGKQRRVKNPEAGIMLQNLAHQVAYERAVARKRGIFGGDPSDISRQGWLDRERRLYERGTKPPSDPSDASRQSWIERERRLRTRRPPLGKIS